MVAKLASLGPTDEVYFSRDEGLCWEGPIKLGRGVIDNTLQTHEGF